MKKSILLLLAGASLGVGGTLVVSRAGQQTGGNVVAVTATPAPTTTVPSAAPAARPEGTSPAATPSITDADPVARSRATGELFSLGWPPPPTTHKMGQYATMKAHHDPSQSMWANGRYIVTEINGKPVEGGLVVRLKFWASFAIPREEPVHLSGYFSREVVSCPQWPLDAPEAAYLDQPQIPMHVQEVFHVTRIIEPAALNADLMQKMGVVLKGADPAATGP